MNPVATEKHIRNMELMLHGGCPTRANYDFGRDEVGHFDGEQPRTPDVHAHPAPSPSEEKQEPHAIYERYVISDEGKMHVETPALPDDTA
jgi:hypothetical protein